MLEREAARPIARGRRLSGSLPLLVLSLRRQIWSRQTLIALVLLALSCAVVLVWSMREGQTVRRFAQELIVPVHASVLVPLIAICYGASSIGGEREESTLVYLLLTPLPRPVVYLVKHAASALLVSAWSLGSFAAMAALAGPPGREAFRLFAPAIGLGCLAYCSLFHLLGAAFRRGTIVSLAYAVFIEGLLGNMPGILKRVSLSFYMACMVYDAGAEHQIGPLVGFPLFLPISGRAAAIVLIVATVLLITLGTILFAHREYRDIG